MTAIVISICALTVSAVSLGWQVVSWLRTGPVIKVKGHSAMPYVGGVVGDHHLSVTAVNEGRAAATITGWGLLLPNSMTIVVQSARLPGVHDLPHRLESHAEASWYILHDELDRACQQQGVAISQVRPFVDVAGQGKVLGKRLG
ncbi:hypothetical protein [Streptomyces sp. NBC_00878]|uniref:hypothetical protein n=1 Tax=Streptomyces sp. NBC_00878 TaxID=2975854 RepID=UPI00224FEA70|nr:hypothetical protein [Streptomyces sp. NBC_00878]MCX4908049.1 hypothetical protein [Streptomyces sp. NBC_00878]